MESKTYKDYYYILGVAPDATLNQIRHAYDDLYDKFGPHASMSGQDPAIMIKTLKDIEEAYECLSDPKRRKEYDGTAGPHLQKSHLRQLWSKLTGVETSAHQVPSSQQMQQQKEQQSITLGLGGGMGSTAGHRVGGGGDPVETRMEIEITLREAMKGASKQIRINDQMPCTACVHMKPIERRACPGCHGTGYLPHDRVEDFPLPGGMYDRMEVRFRGRGKYDLRVGVSGDLVVEVRLRPHSYFTLQGRDICCTVPITIYEAVLGSEIEVPTATGRVIMNVRPLSQHGRVYRLKGLGLAGADLLVTVEIELPSQITGEEVTMFKKLKDMSSPANPRHAIFNKLSQGP
jgi:DnaJ-class molecular chaperone